MIGKAIYNILSNDSTLTSYVSTRIFPVVVPQGEDRASITYRLSAVDPHDSKQNPSRWDRKFIKVSIWTKEYDSTPAIYDIAKAVRNALDKKSPGTYGGVTIGELRFIDEQDGYDNTHDSFVRSQTYSVFMDES